MSECIIILNSARSGSSLLAGMLVKAGVFVSDDLMKPNVFNPNGFFEDNKIKNYNHKVNNLCRVYDPSWSSSFSLPEGWVDSKEVNCVVYGDLRDYIASVYAANDLFLIKEPSIIRLMPLYDKIFRELGITVKYIHLFRHPIEYMHDYKWAFPEVPEPHILWNYVKFNLEAEKFTRDKDRIFLTFNQIYISDKIDILKQIGDKFNIELLKFNDNDKLNIARQNMADFFKLDIRHWRENDVQFNMAAMPNLFISQYAKQAYTVVIQGDNDLLAHTFDNINSKMEYMENKCRMNNLGERTIQIF